MPIKATVSAESWTRLSDLLNDYSDLQTAIQRGMERGARIAPRRVLADLRFTRSEVDRTRFMWQPQTNPTQRRRVGRLIAKGFTRLI